MPGIVLAEEVKNGELSETSKQRLDLGIKLIKGNEIDFLILSGGVRKRNEYKKFIGNNNSLAEIMKNYVILRGVKNSEIILEDLSEETVGQLIFLKQGILDPRNIKVGKIITSAYHAFRVGKEVESIFGNNYHFLYSLIDGFNSKEVDSAQLTGLNKFFETFEGVDFSKDEVVLDTLLNKHAIYTPSSSFYRTELKKMQELNKK